MFRLRASRMIFARLGSLLALLGVLAGAFGAHALRATLPVDRLAAFETAVRYQMFHALALLAGRDPASRSALNGAGRARTRTSTGAASCR